MKSIITGRLHERNLTYEEHCNRSCCAYSEKYAYVNSSLGTDIIEIQVAEIGGQCCRAEAMWVRGLSHLPLGVGQPKRVHRKSVCGRTVSVAKQSSAPPRSSAGRPFRQARLHLDDIAFQKLRVDVARPVTGPRV